MQSNKEQPKQLQNKSLTQSLIDQNPLLFLGNLLGCGMQKDQTKNDSLVINPVIKNLLGYNRSNESMINTSYQVRKWQDQQNQHHFKQSRSIFINDSFEQEKSQKKELKEQSQSTSENNNNILKSIFGLLDSVSNETNQGFGEVLPQQNQNKIQIPLPKIQVQNKVQGQTFLQYHLKISYVHQMESDPDICESFVYQNKTNFNYMQNQSSHFIEFDEKYFQELNKKESQKSQKQRMKLISKQKEKQQENFFQQNDYLNLKVQDNSDINNISIIERSSNHQLSSDVLTSFATNLQQESDKKNSSFFFMSRGKKHQTQKDQRKRNKQIQKNKEKYVFQIQKEKERFKQTNRMAATVQVKPNKIFQQNKTLKFKQFASQPKSKEKQKKCIRKTRSRIISEDQKINTPSASQRPLFQFSSLQFLAAIVQKNGAKYSIKINEGLDNINIQVIPSQQIFLNSTQNQHKKQINSQVMINSVNTNTGYFKNDENNQNSNKKSQQRKISLCQSIEIGNNSLQKKTQIKRQKGQKRQTDSKNIYQKKNHQKKRNNSMNLAKREQLYTNCMQIKQENLQKALFLKRKSTNKKASQKNSTNNSVKQVQAKQNQLKQTLKKYNDLSLKVSRNKKNSQTLKSSSKKKKESSIQNKNKSVQKSTSRNPMNKKQFSCKKKDVIQKSLISLSKQVLLDHKEKFIFSSTDFFEGCFQNGVKSGYGIQKFNNGNLYKGQYKNNKFQGKGIYEWQDGSIYEGQFKDGKINGYGVWRTSKEPASLNLKNSFSQAQNTYRTKKQSCH